LYIDLPLFITAIPPLEGGAVAVAAAAIVGEPLPLRLANRVYLLRRVE